MDKLKRAPVTFTDQVYRFKYHVLAIALAQHQGNRSAAARALGLQRTYFCELIQAFGLQHEAARWQRH